jgi:hypothetical protein
MISTADARRRRQVFALLVLTLLAWLLPGFVYAVNLLQW